MRIKNPLRNWLNHPVLFCEPIKKLHRKFDGQYGADAVAACSDYALRVLRDPFTYAGPGPNGRHHEFVTWYWTHPDLFLETMTTIRAAWYNASSDTFKVQIFISTHPLIMTPRADFIRIEDATDGEISSALDAYWEKKISLAAVKKARQLLSAPASAKGKRQGKKSL